MLTHHICGTEHIPQFTSLRTPFSFSPSQYGAESLNSLQGFLMLVCVVLTTDRSGQHCIPCRWAMGAQVVLGLLVSTVYAWHALSAPEICFPHLHVTLSCAFVMIYHFFLFRQDFLVFSTVLCQLHPKELKLLFGDLWLTSTLDPHLVQGSATHRGRTLYAAITCVLFGLKEPL